MKSLMCAIVLLANASLAGAGANDTTTLIAEGDSGFTAAPAVEARHSMVVTANPLASRAAQSILRQGGSAVDAAIAAQMVLGLVEPQASGLGGGAFMLYWDNENLQLHNYDGREKAPAGVDASHFLDTNQQPLAFLDAVIGGRAVGVPGAVKMLALAHARHGKLPWATLFKPAIDLAEHGFAISARLHTLLATTPRVAVNPTIQAYFFQADGSPKPVGYNLRNEAYARSLKQLAKGGEKAFYSGALARDIVAAVQNNPNRAGKLTLTDMEAYQAVERTPVCGYFRVYKVCGPAPPSAGGIAVLEIIGMLEHFDAAEKVPGSTGFYHLFAEASRLAFADRDAFVADPDFAFVPSAGLIAPVYLSDRAQLIDPARSMAAATAGQPALPEGARQVRYQPARSPELASTSQLSIVDAKGNAVSMTTSIESAFGSRQLVDGFLLNNQLTDFSFAPTDKTGKLVANRIEPGKRPRSSMAPLIVFKDNRPVLIIGSPGGARIIDYVAKTLYYLLASDMPLAQALASPHAIELNQGLELEQGRFDDGQREALRGLGHRLVDEIPQTSGLNVIEITADGLRGGTDPRREGQALGD